MTNIYSVFIGCMKLLDAQASEKHKLEMFSNLREIS